MDKARNAWRLLVHRLLAGAVGVILLTAGVLKATDMELFIGQIRDYGIISQSIVLTLSAWGLIADNNMPSVILLRDGHVQHIWDEKIPDKDGLKEALS